MGSLRALLSALLTVAAAVGFAAPGTAATKKPSAVIEIHQTQVAFLVSGVFGGGTLYFRGKSYPLNVSGLGIGGIGASTITANGEVYDLKTIDDLSGVYGQVRTGWAAGEKGKGELWLQNDKGVVIHLKADRKGLMLAMGADGIVITVRE